MQLKLASYLNIHFNEKLHCLEQTEFSDWTLYSFEQATRLMLFSLGKSCDMFTLLMIAEYG